MRVHVAMAEQLLARTDLSIAPMALRVGFLSPAHFARVFRSMTGQNPSNYRRSFQLWELQQAWRKSSRRLFGPASGACSDVVQHHKPAGLASNERVGY
jgi:AraC-like DNA-binding protein